MYISSLQMDDNLDGKGKAAQAVEVSAVQSRLLNNLSFNTNLETYLIAEC